MTVEGRLTPTSRRMWRRWWVGLGPTVREQVCVDLCLLPRGTASDEGWLAR